MESLIFQVVVRFVNFLAAASRPVDTVDRREPVLVRIRAKRERGHR
jgi:hypothetical protein